MELVSAARTERLDLSFQLIMESSKLSEMAAVCADHPVLSYDDDSVETDTPSVWSGSLSDSTSDLSTISTPFNLLASAGLLEVIDESASTCGVTVDRILDLYPVTPLQENLIALSQSSQDNYVSTYRIEVLPGVDLFRMKSAWEQVYQELEILRTRLIYLPRRDLALQAVIDEKVMEERSQRGRLRRYKGNLILWKPIIRACSHGERWESLHRMGRSSQSHRWNISLFDFRSSCFNLPESVSTKQYHPLQELHRASGFAVSGRSKKVVGGVS